ncbi:hypothetical protein [Ancylobacter vacuolatus]|uniref:Uncharacterized protein n=1 Tax=Ancylobacter vacuolatus TaxID=223389 RepID=A0ABU0DMH9_9HYPH|nr:hypothetical protein [Ancylobacter vacuolatus]MDQ0349617.1 hypothetical protein [Ancylobacter vacuolatus]
MSAFKVSTSFALMCRTAPFLFFRLLVYAGIAAAYVLATGVGAGIGYGVGALWEDESRLSAGFVGAAAGFGLVAAVLYFLREYILYIVKAGHIAVMVELLRGRAVADGQSQIAHARVLVTERFGASNVLFGIDQLVKGVISAVTGLLEGLLSILPLPGVDGLASLLRAYLKIAVGLMDEVMLAQCFDDRGRDPYTASRTALVLYAQNARRLMISAAWVTAGVWLLSLLVFLVMLGPAGALVWLMPGQLSAGGLIFAALFAWSIKAALIEPFAVACMLQAYFNVTAGQTLDPEWEAKLDATSDRFKALGQRAGTWVGGRMGYSAQGEPT